MLAKNEKMLFTGGRVWRISVVYIEKAVSKAGEKGYDYGQVSIDVNIYGTE